MSAREDADSSEGEEPSGDEEQEAEDRDENDTQSEQEEEEEEEQEQPPPKKKRAAAEIREWTEVNRWDHSDSTPEDIIVFIRTHLNDLNRSSGIQELPSAHRDRKDAYGSFQFRRTWRSNNHRVTNTILNCPLSRRCGCQCEAKIVETPTQTILFIYKSHTAADHVSHKDQAKFLSHQQKDMIASAVKIAPLQTSGELIRDVQDSPTKKIDAKLKQSVSRLVRKERKRINKIILEGVPVDNTLGSLAALSDTLWFGKALEQHKAGNCIPDVHKVYVIGRQILASDRTVFLTFANPFDLLNLFRSVASGYDVQLQGDVTAKASQAALNKLGFGVNMLGSSFAPLSFTLIPAECESAAAYREAFNATKAAIRALIGLPVCNKDGCTTCNYEQFYEYVCRIMKCSFEGAGVRLHQLLVQWMRS